MFCSFVSFITIRGFFQTYLENIVYDDAHYEEMMISKMRYGYLFKILILEVEDRGANGRRKPRS